MVPPLEVERKRRPALLWLLVSAVVVFVPSVPLGFLDGLPADHAFDFALVLALAAFILCRDFSGVAPRRWRLWCGLVLVAAGLRLASAWVLGPHGLQACHECEVMPGQRRVERSTAADVRIERVLDYAGVGVGLGRRPLWTDYLNALPQPGKVSERLARPVKVVWQGFIEPTRDCSLTVEASCPCDLSLGTETLRKGERYPIRLEARFPNLLAPRLRLFTNDDGRTVPAHWLLPREQQSGSWGLALLLLAAGWGAVVVLLVLVARLPLARACRDIEGKVLLLCVALAVGIGLWEYQLAKDPTFSILPPDDYILYETEARNLACNGFLRDDGVAFHRSPAMRYYLAAGHALFGEAVYGVVLWQQVLRGLTALLVLALSRRLGLAGRLGWLAAGLVVTFPTLLRFSLFFWPETLGAFLFSVVCLAAVWGEKVAGTAGIGRAAGLGAAAGLLALARTNAISLIPALFVWLLFRRRGGRALAAFLLAACLTIGFVPLRNYLVTHQWVPWPTEGPITLVIGNNIPRDTDISFALSGDPQHDAFFLESMEHLWDFKNNPQAVNDVFGPAMNARVSRALGRVWLAYVVQHPVHYLKQVSARALEWFFPDRNILLLYSCLACAGLVFLARERAPATWWVLLFVLAVYTLPFLAAYYESRYRVVVLPEWILLAVFGGGRLRDWYRNRQRANGACPHVG